jgi:hypothetical protein
VASLSPVHLLPPGLPVGYTLPRLKLVTSFAITGVVLLQMPLFTYADSSGPLLDKGSFDFVLLQGSTAWLQSFVHSSWLALPVLWTSSPSPAAVASPFLHTRAFSHTAHGGLLDASFTFFSSTPFLDVSPRPYPLRVLLHVLSTAVREIRDREVPAPILGGALVSSPVHWVPDHPGVIDWGGGGCFPSHCEIPQVRCK